ncbi:MAG: lipase [bacterium]
MKLIHRVVPLAAILIALAGCGGSSKDNSSAPTGPAVNNNGTPATATVTALFNPTEGVLPFPNNLLLSGTTDLTVNPPTADPSDISDPAVVLSALDGFSTTAPWATNFSATIDPASVLPGQTVRLFRVRTSPQGATLGVEQEMVPGVDYFATMSSATTLAIIPLKPLQELTSYMAVVTNGVHSPEGNDVTPDQVYFIAKRTSPLVDASGNSTDPLLPNSTAQALEPLRQLTNSQEFAASAMGINPADIVLSWVATTQGITPVLGAVHSISPSVPVTLAPTGLDTGMLGLGLPGIADLYIGMMPLPYYLDAPSAENPTAILTAHWEAEPGAYVAPFDQLGLDPTSTNITYANPVPVVKSTQMVPVMMSLPNAKIGAVKPDAGWPVVIFQHGITRDRTDMIALADRMAGAGFAVIAIDQPLHGVTDTTNGFYIENTPLGAFANERTFDADFANNTTGAPGPDGVIDSSGSYTINLKSLLTSRDNVRQAVADLFVLSNSIGGIDIDGDSIPDFDTSHIEFVSQSLGSIVGTVFLAYDSNVNAATLSVPGGGIMRMLEASPSFGPPIIGGLAAAGLVQGSADYNSYMTVGQTAIDSTDPINFAAMAAARHPVLLQEVVGGPDSLPDQVIPNSVATAPLSGTEPMIAAMGLSVVANTTANPDGIRGVSRFSVGSHGSLLTPVGSPEAFETMQTQAVTFSLSSGQSVAVPIPEILVGE